MRIPELVTVVVPTRARPSVAVLLNSLDRAAREVGQSLPVVLVDDRRTGPPLHTDPWRHLDVRLLPGGGAGDDLARDLGWRCAASRWVCFLDEDVVPDTNWLRSLVHDLTGAWPGVEVVTGRRHGVPAPGDQPPPDVAVTRRLLDATGGLRQRGALRDLVRQGSVGSRGGTVRPGAA